MFSDRQNNAFEYERQKQHYQTLNGVFYSRKISFVFKIRSGSLPTQCVTITSSPMGNGRSPWSKHNVWRHHNLRCSKADNSELETVNRN